MRNGRSMERTVDLRLEMEVDMCTEGEKEQMSH